jgi:N-acetylated-alpha-linked acidic dipeptidase
MRVLRLLTAVALLWTTVTSAATISSGETEVERKFDAMIHPSELRDWMKLLASEPNHVGSPHNKANAHQILSWFKQWGWDARIERFWVLYPTPLSENLELVGTKPFKATLQEPPIPGDTR